MKVPKPIKLDSGNWFIRMRLGGESIPITMPTKAECIREAQLIKAEHIAGKRKPKAKAGDMTIGQLLDAYIAEIKPTASPSTIRGYKSIRDNRFAQHIDTAYKDIKNWQALIDTETGNVAPKTVKSSWYCLCTAMRRKDLPVPAVRLPAVPENEHEFLTYEQIPVFLEAIQGDMAETAALILLHSCRLSEACALTWEDHIDLSKRMIKVKGAYINGDEGYVVNITNKNKTSQRYIPIMINRLYDLLEAEPDKQGRVITIAPNTITRHINSACKAAGLPEVGAHGLRHSFASLSHHLGIPQEDCMRLGGWSDLKTMRKIYTHIADKDSLRWQNKMAEFYNNANENANGAIKT